MNIFVEKCKFLESTMSSMYRTRQLLAKPHTLADMKIQMSMKYYFTSWKMYHHKSQDMITDIYESESENVTNTNTSNHQNIDKDDVFNSEIEYQKSNLIITPVTSISQKDYDEQVERIDDGLPHMWDDSKTNSAVIGDYFGYVWNQKKKGDTKTDGKIILYKIIDVLKPDQRLPTWSNNVGQGYRNVIVLTSESVYAGTCLEFKTIMGYASTYNLQGTLRADIKKTHTYFDKIFN